MEELLNKLLIVEKYFTGTKYQDIVSSAKSAYAAKDFDGCKVELSKFPTQKQLLEVLLKKLKGKSVSKSLKKIEKGCSENSYTALKALTSLLTHTIIEVEQGNKEYSYLIPLLLDKINEVNYNVK